MCYIPLVFRPEIRIVMEMSLVTRPAGSVKDQNIRVSPRINNHNSQFSLAQSSLASNKCILRQNEGRTQVSFRHPGTESQVLMTPDSDQVKVTIRRKNFVATLHQFHRLHGYHGGWNYTLWAIVYDLSSISMILFSLTGFYLWYKTERVRWPGWIIFTAFTAFTGFTIVYLSFMH